MQFVRAISPSTSYAPAAVALATNYGWKRVCTLGFKSPDYVAAVTSWTSALVQKSINVRNTFLDELGFRRAGSLSSALSTIEADRLRVIMVFATPDFVKQVALTADAMGFVSSGWAWISDGAVGKIDFKGNARDVRATSTRRPLHAQSSRNNLRSCAVGWHTHVSRSRGCDRDRCDASQGEATRRAFNGWLCISPLEPDTPTVRKFKQDVRKLTQSKFGIALAESEEIDSAATKLYDGIFLWARALSRVFAGNGAWLGSCLHPPATLVGRRASESSVFGCCLR